MALCPEHPKRDQNPKFTPLSETTSIPVCFIWESPPPPPRVPNTLRNRAVDLAHVGHQGIVKTKQLIREKVWFPGVDEMVKEKVDCCLPCQAATTCKAQRLEPLRMTPLPTAPWKELAMDFLGPLPSGDYLMVVIDEYSRFPEVEIVTSMHFRQIHNPEARRNFRKTRDS